MISLIPESCIYSPAKSLSRHFWKTETKISQITPQIHTIYILFGSSPSSFYLICRIRMSGCFCACGWFLHTNLPLYNISGSMTWWQTNCLNPEQHWLTARCWQQSPELPYIPGYLAEDVSKPFTFSSRMKRGVFFNLQTEHRCPFFHKTAL